MFCLCLMIEMVARDWNRVKDRGYENSYREGLARVLNATSDMWMLWIINGRNVGIVSDKCIWTTSSRNTPVLLHSYRCVGNSDVIQLIIMWFLWIQYYLVHCTIDNFSWFVTNNTHRMFVVILEINDKILQLMTLTGFFKEFFY